MSINPLELLGSVFVLDFVGHEGMLSNGEDMVILGNENESACDAVNRGGSDSLPMRSAL